MKAWFSALNQREQLSLLLLAVAVFLYVLFAVIWLPLAEKRDSLITQNTAISGSLTRVDAMVSELQQLRASGSKKNSRRNLTSLINRSTGSLKLPVSRLQPNSRGEIQVRFESVVFDDVLGWLYEMEYKEGLLVRDVSITETGTAGRVNATVRIAQAG